MLLSTNIRFAGESKRTEYLRTETCFCVYLFWSQSTGNVRTGGFGHRELLNMSTETFLVFDAFVSKIKIQF